MVNKWGVYQLSIFDYLLLYFCRKPSNESRRKNWRTENVKFNQWYWKVSFAAATDVVWPLIGGEGDGGIGEETDDISDYSGRQMREPWGIGRFFKLYSDLPQGFPRKEILKMLRGSGCLAEVNAYQGSLMSLKGDRLSAEVVSWGLTAIEFSSKEKFSLTVSAESEHL